jgi:hypothetical protein
VAYINKTYSSFKANHRRVSGFDLLMTRSSSISQAHTGGICQTLQPTISEMMMLDENCLIITTRNPTAL